MASTPASTVLDLSRLPALQLVGVDYEAERASVLASVKARLAARDIDFDADGLESETIVILAEEVAYRRVLGLQVINDAGKQMTVAHGYGDGLDHLAATYYADVQVVRLANETDDRFQRRILLAASAPSPGTLRGYEYWALTFGPFLLDALALNHASGVVAPGDIAIILLGDPSADADAAEAVQVQKVIAGLLDPAIKLGSDNLIIRAASRSTTTLAAVLQIPPGPDEALLVEAARRALSAYLGRRRRIGLSITVSGVHAALTVGGVEGVRLLNMPADLTPPADGVIDISEISITTELVHG